MLTPFFRLNDRPTWSHGSSSNGTGPQSFVNPGIRSGDNLSEEQGNKPTHPRTEEISQQLTVLSNDISNYSVSSIAWASIYPSTILNHVVGSSRLENDTVTTLGLTGTTKRRYSGFSFRAQF